MKIHRALALACVLASQLASGPLAIAQEADAKIPIEPEALASLQVDDPDIPAAEHTLTLDCHPPPAGGEIDVHGVAGGDELRYPNSCPISS